MASKISWSANIYTGTLALTAGVVRGNLCFSWLYRAEDTQTRYALPKYMEFVQDAWPFDFAFAS